MNKELEKGGSLYYAKRAQREIDRGRYGYFDTGKYKLRAEVIADWIKDMNPSVVLSVASGGIILGKIMKELMPDVKFRWSEFSLPRIEKAKEDLEFVEYIDLREPLPDEDYDVIVCVSVEHLEDDFFFINNIPAGKKVIFSLPDRDADSHYRVYSSEEYIRERYSDIVEIEEIKKLGVFYLLKGTKK